VKEEQNVTLQVRSWRLATRVLLLAVAIAAAPLPCLAETAIPPVPATPVLKASIAQVAAVVPLAPARGQATGGKTTDKSELGSGSFFKKPAGIIALAVVAAGAGYAVYSLKHDRIHSVARAGQ
jgi:hypothetical protein